MIHLSVNINKIATLRNSRGGNIPDLVQYGKMILDLGANGLTIHPRSDERHITRTDIPAVKKLLSDYNKTSADTREFNIEGEPSARFLDIVLEYLPDQVTLVPVSPGEITSDHGFRFPEDVKILEPLVDKIKQKKMRVSLFVEAGVKNISIARDIGADRIELYTGPFAEAFDHSPQQAEALYQKYVQTAQEAIGAGLAINAGHDLDHENLRIFRNLPGLEEVSIGHRLLSLAMAEGLSSVMNRYLTALAPDS